MTSFAVKVFRKPIRLYMGDLILVLGVNTLYMLFWFLNREPTPQARKVEGLSRPGVSKV